MRNRARLVEIFLRGRLGGIASMVEALSTITTRGRIGGMIPNSRYPVEEIR